MITANEQDKREAYSICVIEGLATGPDAVFEQDKNQYTGFRIFHIGCKSDKTSFLCKFMPDELPPP